MLLDKEKPEHELMVFANAFAKYQRQNPFRKVLNKNVPLILLIQTIKLLNEDADFDGTGISRFVSDDEGLPTSFASGGNPDIECLEEEDTVLIEVTLLTGTQQHIRESFSVQRHLEEYIKNGVKSYAVFISPKSFIDTERYFKFIKNDGFEVRISNIDKFVYGLEEKMTLNEATL